MLFLTTARVRVIPIEGLPPAEILLAWRPDRAAPLVEALIHSAKLTLRSPMAG